MRSKEALLGMFRDFDSRGGPIPLDGLVRSLKALRLTRDDLGDAVVFDERAYQRVAIRRAAHYEALVLGWRSGQGSPIHDHAGSSCAVLVVEGCATETVYSFSPCGRLVPARSRRHRRGAITGCHDRGTHQMANLEPPGRDLITLHLYSPPPSTWSYYRLDDTSLADHDRLITDRPETLRVDLGHGPAAGPHVRTSRGSKSWKS